MRKGDITPKILYKLYHKELLSKKEIALRLDCNIITVHKKIKKFGIPVRDRLEAVRLAMRKQIISIPRKKLQALYIERKQSVTEIADELDYSRDIILRELRRHDISLRSRAEIIKTWHEQKKIKKSLIYNLYYRQKLTQQQIAERLGKSRELICRLMKEHSIKTRTPAYYLTKYLKHNFSKNYKEKAYLIGFRLGDLAASLTPSGKFVRVDTTSTKYAQILLFRNLFRKYGRVWISHPRKDGNRVCVVYLNHTFDFLLPKKDNIPKWIRENKNFFLHFLSGYTDAEGCIWYKSYPRFTLASYDKNILRQIYTNLNKFGIECSPPRVMVKAGHIKSDGIIYRKDCWRLTLSKKVSLIKLFALLSKKLRHIKRIKNLQQALYIIS